MKKYKLILVFILIASTVDLVMTRILFGRLDTGMIAATLISCIIAGIIFNWISVQIKKRQLRRNKL